jgi:hypothetical protein
LARRWSRSCPASRSSYHGSYALAGRGAAAGGQPATTRRPLRTPHVARAASHACTHAHAYFGTQRAWRCVGTAWGGPRGVYRDCTLYTATVMWLSACHGARTSEVDHRNPQVAVSRGAPGHQVLCP